jgi:hypothetical protein
MIKQLTLLLLIISMAGAAKYHVNCNSAFDGTGTGTAIAPFTGCAGLQKAFTTIAAGDTVLVTGTAQTSKMPDIVYNLLTGGTFTVNSVVNNVTRTGTMRILTDNSSTTMLVEILTGTFLTGDSIQSGSVGARINGALQSRLRYGW